MVIVCLPAGSVSTSFTLCFKRGVDSCDTVWKTNFALSCFRHVWWPSRFVQKCANPSICHYLKRTIMILRSNSEKARHFSTKPFAVSTCYPWRTFQHAKSCKRMPFTTPNFDLSHIWAIAREIPSKIGPQLSKHLSSWIWDKIYEYIYIIDKIWYIKYIIYVIYILCIHSIIDIYIYICIKIYCISDIFPSKLFFMWLTYRSC